MNQYITGAIIRQLRENSHLTQAELAEKLCVSDKTVSKWETAKGYPDISLLESLAQIFNVSVADITIEWHKPCCWSSTSNSRTYFILQKIS